MNSNPSFCQYCGSPLNAGAAFCSRCGKPVASAPAPAAGGNETLPSYQAPAYPPQPSYPPNPSFSPPSSFPPPAYPPQPPYYGSYPKRRSSSVVIVIIVLMIVLLAAGGVMAYFFLAPAQVAQVAPTLAIVVPSLAPPAAVETGPTLEPTAAPDVSYNGVSFSYNHFLGGGVNQEVLPAVQPDSNSAPFDVIPQHYAFTFTNYTLSNTFHTPQILILPVDDYINMIPELKPRVELLKSLIASRPATVTNDLPFLPMWNAGMVFHSNLKYIDFKNGSGIRFLTMFSQGIMPVTNDSLFYTYQGITSDGKYYISIVMPVHTPKLPNEADLTQQDYDSINNNYNQYIQTVSSVLDTQDNSRYSPNLDWLDEMAASFSIKP